MTEYSYGPWIKHDGKGMPVDGDTLVEVKYENGNVDKPCEAEIHDLLDSWGPEPMVVVLSISEYRIVNEAKL
ncbi:hypothetical protein [Rhizobium alvei]|uniref:Uncharacterized protein n=1 Tax=Rhizobium alvei TaxID=1132659 RepID=A0ABT8YTP8_9HYPH|nr:hypothetical protein [Rhizobium alvei]MDO6966966.1 hypothetical protein [Rhizobium alvei]